MEGASAGRLCCVGDASDGAEDPGWPSGWSALAFLIPGLIRRRARQSGDGLVLLRQVMESFTVSLVLFGIVLTFLDAPAGQTWLFLAVLAVLAVVSVVVVSLVTRPLDCTSHASLAGSYRTRFFLRVAFAQSVALFGFVFAFIGGGAVTYYAGAAFALYRYWTGIAPTRAALARDQAELQARGCNLSLVASLRSAMPPATG